jgi:integrase
MLPARWTAVRFPIDRLHHVGVGMTFKTLANHKSNVRAGLRWVAGERDVPARGAPLSVEWKVLHERLPNLRARANLTGLTRFCSARTVSPQAVDQAMVDAFMAYRAETTALATGNAARRSLARAWNACIGTVMGWPAHRLVEPPVKAMEGPAWQGFPAGLRAGIERYLSDLAKPRRSYRGKRLRPCKDSTIRTRKAELAAFVRMAVKLGVPLGSLTSIGTLLHPDMVERVIDAYWQKDGEEPRIYTIELGSKLLAVARASGELDDLLLERLDDMRAGLDQYRRDGLSEKNRALIREVLSGNIWAEVVNLPAALLKQARGLKDHAPVKAAVLAQIAVAIAILTFAPVRLINLVRTRLDENLIKPGGIDNPYWLVFPDYDVKNRVPLEFQFDQILTDCIDEYVNEFRPVLLRGSNEAWLFPGEAGGFKTPNMFSTQITESIRKAVGLRITVHQFRHAAAAGYLRHRPGEYESVRRLLGHRSIKTTMNFYCGLETTQATKTFGEIVRQHMSFDPEPA